MPNKITAWLSIGSTYTYLTALRIKAIQKKHNLVLHINPISIRKITIAMDNVPFPSSKNLKSTTCGVTSKEGQNSMVYQNQAYLRRIH